MADKASRETQENTHEQQKKHPVETTTVSIAPDGGWQSTLTFSLQLTNIWGDAGHTVATFRRGSEDPNSDDGTKHGMGPTPKSAGAGDNDNPDTEPKDTVLRPESQ